MQAGCARETVCAGAVEGRADRGSDKGCSSGLAEVHLASVRFSGEATPWKALLVTHTAPQGLHAGRHPSPAARAAGGQLPWGACGNAVG